MLAAAREARADVGIAAQPSTAVRVGGAWAVRLALPRTRIAALTGQAVQVGFAARDTLVVLAALAAAAVGVAAARRVAEAGALAAFLPRPALRVAGARTRSALLGLRAAAFPGETVTACLAAWLAPSPVTALPGPAVRVGATLRSRARALATLLASAALGIHLTRAGRVALLGGRIAALARQTVRVALAARFAASAVAARAGTAVSVDAAGTDLATAVAALAPWTARRVA